MLAFHPGFVGFCMCFVAQWQDLSMKNSKKIDEGFARSIQNGIDRVNKRNKEVNEMFEKAWGKKKMMIRFIAACPICGAWPQLTDRGGGWTADCGEHVVAKDDLIAKIFAKNCEFISDSKMFIDPSDAVKNWNKHIRKVTGIDDSDYIEVKK